MKRIAIIGGGMAGLAAAHHLQHHAGDVDWQLYEQAPRLGGKVVTDHVDGFTIEGGPDSFITQKPWGLALCRELGLEPELMPCNEASQKIYILVRNRLCTLPAGFRLTVPTRIGPFLQSPLFSWGAKLRMGLEVFIPPRTDNEDESVAAFITRRLGREAAEKIGGPLMAGIYVADPERLSLLSTFPMFRAMERKHGSLIRAMRQARTASAGAPPMFMSLRRGMQRLTDRISAPLADRCRTGAAVTGLERADGGYAVVEADRRSVYDAVILACPLDAASGLLTGLAPRTAATLAAVRYVSTATVSLGYRLPLDGVAQPLDAFGFVIPAAENRPILACTFSSSKFDARAPDGHALLRVFVGGEGREALVEQDDDALIRLVREELRAILGLRAEPLVARVYRWPRGNPQYDVGHAARMQAALDEVHALPGLDLAGSGYQGIGLPDCIHSGQTAADRVLNGLSA